MISTACLRKIESSPAITDLKIYDSQLKNFPTQMKIDLAKRAEDASFAADKKITNSDGAEYRDHDAQVYLSNSSGSDLNFQRTYISLSCSPVAEKDGEKRSNYFWDAKSLLEELEPPEKIGRTATERTVRMLGSKKIDTQKVPYYLRPFYFLRIPGRAFLWSQWRFGFEELDFSGGKA